MSDDIKPRLPIEVIEGIIDSVYELGYKNPDFRALYTTWKACALTCHAMTPRSQFWLFRDTVLATESQALNFIAVLRRNTAIAPHVQVLTLSGPGQDEAGRGFTWISWIPLVSAPLMKNLQELWLESDALRDCHPGLPRALTAFKSIPKLGFSGVSFSSFGHCLWLIRAFPHLRHLTFSNVSWKPDPPGSQFWRSRDRSGREGKRLQLAHLDLVGEDSNVRPFAKWLSDVGAAKSLRTFFGFSIAQEFAFHCGSSIRSIALDCESDVSIQIPNGSFAGLETMYLQMVDETFPLQLLTSIAVAASPQLRELAVYLSVEDDKIPVEPALTERELTAYAELDAALCKPVLSGMRLSVCVYEEGASLDAMDRWVRKLVVRLPKFCSGEGRLVVEWFPFQYPLARWLNERDGFS